MAEITSIESLPQRRLECRSWLHSWKHLQTQVLEGDWEGYLSLKLTCTRCTTQREDILEWETGTLHRRRYTYATGYLIGPTVETYGGRIKFNGAVRRELVGRLLEGH
jgi:hypothetical protein